MKEAWQVYPDWMVISGRKEKREKEGLEERLVYLALTAGLDRREYEERLAFQVGDTPCCVNP